MTTYKLHSFDFNTEAQAKAFVDEMPEDMEHLDTREVFGIWRVYWFEESTD